MKQYSIKNPPELPASCPPLREGLVYLGLGKTFATSGMFKGVWLSCRVDGSTYWEAGNYFGDEFSCHYAAPEGSQIVKLNFGEPLGSWADRLPREYVDLVVARSAPEWPVSQLGNASFDGLFDWVSTPEGLEFWSGVSRYVDGQCSALPPIPVSGAAASPEKLCDLPTQAAQKEKPLTTAEQVRRIAKKLEEQDALLASIQKLITDFNASNS